MQNSLDNNRTYALMAILILEVVSLSIVGTSQFVTGLDSNIVKNLVKNQGTAFNDKISKIISSIKKSVVDAQPTADTGKLIVIKKVVCINWPEKEFGPCPFLPEHFIIVVTGNRDFPSRFRGSATGTEVILGLGPYKVSDVGPLDVVRDITPSFSGDCRQIGQLSSAQGAIRNAGETQTCTIFNTLRFS